MKRTTIHSTKIQRLQKKAFIYKSLYFPRKEIRNSHLLLLQDRRRTPFDAAYNSAFKKPYHYPYDTKMIFDLAIALINGATQEDVCQIKEAEYIEYIIELARFDYEDEVETYHQITSHTYPTKKAQIQQLEQINIQLCEECVMPCDNQ
ncbi:hypothetical protein G9A89_009114 [Geosiphon pyriformis]|nr:hypothetical protein G9A89_009114 [Geosiphon pyriformis]